ncbi:MAG: chemotaxis protein MotB [Thalassovita sp.]
MDAQSNVAPVIIKRKKVVAGGGHHGGAWKVAYADFVTAMMAFFMLMWLLNATTEKQRKGLADYFSPTIAISRISGGGDGTLNGSSVFSEETLPQVGTGASNMKPTEGAKARGELGSAELGMTEPIDGQSTSLSELESLLLGRGGESMVSPEMRRHIITRVTDEGLIVELFDLPEAPLFDPQTGDPTPLLIAFGHMLGATFDLVTNAIAVEGHTQAQPIVLAKNPVWNTSTKRADKMRELLEISGTQRDRIKRVTGHADREPVHFDPMSVRNNRLELILLRN